jgi:DNA helicase-4
MTNFDEWFGEGVSLPLQTTFRCTQSICDVSSGFVSKNPRQMRKAVRSHSSPYGGPVLLASVDEKEAIPGAIGDYLREIAMDMREGRVVSGGNGQVTVDILGRYHRDHDFVPAVAFPEIVCTFRTIHGSKGLEADYVVIANALTGHLGFPSQIEDDPILDLAMVDPDDFMYAEERRLMYVALTRARRQVLITTVRGRESPFVAELLADGLLTQYGETRNAPPPKVCPTCRQGVLTLRNGRYGEFFGCNRFPACRHTEKAG